MLRTLGSPYANPWKSKRLRPITVACMSFALGQSATSPGHASMSERSPEADIELNVAEEHRRGGSKSTFAAME